MDARIAWLALVLCAGGVLTLIVQRRKSGPIDRSPAPAAAPAVARTHFTADGGYVEIDGVVRWATASPGLPILPGHVLQYELNGDGHTLAVARAAHHASEERSA